MHEGKDAEARKRSDDVLAQDRKRYITGLRFLYTKAKDERVEAETAAEDALRRLKHVTAQYEIIAEELVKLEEG